LCLPVRIPVVVGPQSPQIQHVAGVLNVPPGPGDLQPRLNHMTVAAILPEPIGNSAAIAAG